ncbi:MAG: NAD-dependent epimerase/dehydratase family protein [Bacteroidetes bacterium]|nr:NAD-dependent epimerase/dehydratase family protein [Bacteroidota bacterium]MBK9673673.1 NAD-dependent epimerase/dehydratase family protein [Bacteroidota bacterium]MBP6414407.1 NAD-dependent epimerase/dehydratase family protein [Bacteroidia bacterium]
MILVTGGSGLLGSHLLYELASMGKKIRVLVRNLDSKAEILQTFSFYTATPEHILQQVEFAIGDVLDVFSLLDALEGVEQVYHCAAMVSFSPRAAERMLKTNIEGTANVVNACLEKKIHKLCHVSSVAALGKALDNEEVTEETFWKNSSENSVYSISKYSSEREVWRGVQEGLQAIVVNPTVILGPGNWAKGSSNLFRSAKKGMKFYTNGITGFVDVRDVASCMIKLMESSIVNERFIITSENIAYREFFNWANSAFNKSKPVIYAYPILSNLVWRLEKIKCFITQTEPLITKETTRAAHQQNFFSNHKLVEAIRHVFIPIKESINHTCSSFSKII